MTPLYSIDPTILTYTHFDWRSFIQSKKRFIQSLPLPRLVFPLKLGPIDLAWLSPTIDRRVSDRVLLFLLIALFHYTATLGRLFVSNFKRTHFLSQTTADAQEEDEEGLCSSINLRLLLVILGILLLLAICIWLKASSLLNQFYRHVDGDGVEERRKGHALRNKISRLLRPRDFSRRVQTIIVLLYFLSPSYPRQWSASGYNVHAPQDQGSQWPLNDRYTGETWK